MRKIINKITIFLIILSYNITINASEMKIHVIDYDDAYMGDSVLIEQNNYYLLMDVSLGATNKVMEYLDNHNITNFDLYLSHYHGDHYGSGSNTKVITPTYIEKIMNNKKYNINKIYVPNPDNNNKNSLGDMTVKQIYNRISNCAKSNNIQLIKLNQNSTFNIGVAKAKVVYFNPMASNENDSSLVTLITIDDKKYLTAGDIGPNVEKEIINQKIDVKADIMKLSHHGVDDSNSTIFLNNVKPKYVFYQLGQEGKNSFASFSRSVDTINRVSQIANLYSIKYNGTILFRILNGNISVSLSRNYKTININYYDTDTNKGLLGKINRYNIATKYYLYDDLNIDSYIYDKEKNKNIILSGKLYDNMTINLYYKKSNNLSFNDSNLQIKNNYIRIKIPYKINNTSPGKITYQQFKSKINSNKNIILKNEVNKSIANENEIIKTGYQLIIDKNYYISIITDVSGDGIINALDYIKIRNHLLGNITLKDCFIESADINNDNKVNSLDYIMIRNMMLNK